MKPRDVLPSIDLDALEQVDGAFFRISFGPSPIVMSPFAAMLADADLFMPYAAPTFNVVFGGRPMGRMGGAPRPPAGGRGGFHGGTRRT